MRPAPAQVVLDWFAVQEAEALHITAITEAELRAGAAILSAGRRRDAIEAAIDAVVRQDFAGRVLPFDGAAARAYAAIRAERRTMGRPIAEADAQIAAIARTRGAAVATRNVVDFEGCGVEIIDPWKVGATPEG